MNKLRINFETDNLNEVWQTLFLSQQKQAKQGISMALWRETGRRVFWITALICVSLVSGYCLLKHITWFVFPLILFLFFWLIGTGTLLSIKEQRHIRDVARYSFDLLKNESSIKEANDIFDFLIPNIPIVFLQMNSDLLMPLAEMVRKVTWLVPFTEITEDNIIRHKYNENGALEIYYVFNHEDRAVALSCEKRETQDECDILSYENDMLVYYERR